MNIDWSKAPAWAVGHALHAFGGEIREVWVGEHQYQRLDQPKPFPYGGGNSDHRHNPRRSEFHFEQLRPAPWTGKGLPPVGTVCEFAGGTNCPEDPFDKDLKEGDEVTIIAHFKDGESELAAFTFNPRNLSRGNACVEQGMHGCFRPIRTPEQIAAEEREKAIAEMVYGGCGCDQSDGTTTAFVICRLLYDAGYRKQVSE
ncbi:hypothetical protein [Pseudomonas sp. MF7448]|uniref:hypothetical protein n=1 Tax=Pseudomonas sp. MF7448 TaxID=2797537 RepID=UPI00190D0B7B|nr:hypothetical protein [Pseudomonas sp. MF7448]MBK3437450.1 hypothetical protein [Pseudomonas sp. MF7448]